MKKQCPFCAKEIIGTTEMQREYLLKQHILSKHPDKVIFKTADEVEDETKTKTNK